MTCPYKVIAACSECWNNDKVSEQRGDAGRCCAQHAPSGNVVYVLMPEEIELRALPTQCLSGQFRMCKRIHRAIPRCTYPGCTFGHTEEELQVWRWMAEHHGKDFDASILHTVKVKVNHMLSAVIYYFYVTSISIVESVVAVV